MYIPEPETKRALLASAGRPSWTVHTYVRTDPVRIASKTPGKEHTSTPGWSHIFRCEVTGAERRWGLEAA